MTDRPIIFSAPMVRALLEGRKSMTRRVLCLHDDDREPPYVAFYPEGACAVWCDPYDSAVWRFPGVAASAVGDRLWVRETWHPVMEGHPVILCKADNRIVYHDTGRTEPNVIYEQPTRWRSPIHMPRKLSRLTLIVTDVRVQRVQEISHSDAIDEGCDYRPSMSPQQGFQMVWDQINAERPGTAFGWSANPWVVALTFTVHHQNIDQMEREDAS